MKELNILKPFQGNVFILSFPTLYFKRFFDVFGGRMREGVCRKGT